MTINTVIRIKKKASPLQYGVIAVVNAIADPSHKLEWVDACEGNVAVGDVSGISHVSRLLLRSMALDKRQEILYPMDPMMRTNIDYWIDFAFHRFSTSDFKKLNPAFKEANHHLKMRSFFVGYHPSAADFIMWGALRSCNIWLKVLKTPKEFINLVRWYEHISSLPEAIQAVSAFQKSQEVTKDKKDQGTFKIDLQGAKKGQVVTRFPPEPSGYLHIGHAKAVLLNEYFARSYEGTLLIRFDDTNPSKEKVEFEESILEDLKMLGVKGDKLSYTSDHFDLLLQLAEKMIKNGNAYVDDSPVELMRQQRMDGIASKCREISVEENLKRFNEMKLGTEWGLGACLRAKISVDAKNKAMRDPVIYRCNLIPHNRTKDRYKVYPTYDFCCPIVDSIEGVTHALRTNEYHDRNDQYYWFIKILELRKPLIWDFSRVNFVYTLMSKRKLQWFVDQKQVSGWDDPRFPTVRGILRRGMTVEALKQYTLMQGASKNTILMEWDKIWSLNKQIIDPIAARFTGLDKDKIVTVKLSNGPISPETKEILKHKKNPDLGNKSVEFSNVIYLAYEDAKDMIAEEEVTLMDWGNMIVSNVHQENGNVVSIDARLHLEGDFKKTKKKLTWLSANPSILTPLVLIDYDYLITKKKLEEEDSFEDCLNPVTEFKTESIGDSNLRNLKQGEIIQLERRGYFRCDQPFSSSSPCHLIMIPDGKVSSISLKSEVKK